ncbi:hypothetical protein [Streptomyces sp. bgisy126]|uniref:hypothetical protein n=1 Tax=unclassified Streptomyces TaxID=2593676 RepID=UPI003EBB622D
MTDVETWRHLWEKYKEPDGPGAVVDACSGIRIFTEDHAVEPAATIALAIAGAEAAEGLRNALKSDWSLYTPQQVAVVAAAVFAQLSTAADTLESLRRLIEQAEARHETASTSIADDRLMHAAAAAVFAREFAGPVVDALSACPNLASLPDNPHKVLVSVAGLLGPTAKIMEYSSCSDADEKSRCDCTIRFEHRDQVWNFYQGDSSWDLLREKDRKLLKSGSVVHAEWHELGTLGNTPHPQHLVTLIRAKLNEIS